jgi:hypothetical protein
MSDLYNYIDALADLSALVYSPEVNAYLPYNKAGPGAQRQGPAPALPRHAVSLCTFPATPSPLHLNVSRRARKRETLPRV